MTRTLFYGAALVGLLAIAWTATTFIDNNALALSITLIIGVVYVLGLAELRQIRLETRGLNAAIGQEPDKPENLLAQVHGNLHGAINQRIAGFSAPLPAPVFTPYFTGLLVMLGLLGTFVGMVDTLQGAVAALQGNTELSAIRDGLAAPIQGLGVAFGTSVAGVAASAMLGLATTLARRERLAASRTLDQYINHAFAGYSRDASRDQAFQALQSQAEAWPELVRQMCELADHLKTSSTETNSALTQTAQSLQQGQSELTGELVTQLKNLEASLNDNHASQQQAIAQRMDELGTTLTQSVSESLLSGLEQSADRAAENFEPLLNGLLASIGEQATNTQQQLGKTAQEHLQQLNKGFESQLAAMAQQLETLSAQQQDQTERMSKGLNQQVEVSSARLQELAEHHQNQLDSINSSIAERMQGIATQLQELVAQHESQLAQAYAEREQFQGLLENLEQRAGASLSSAGDNLAIQMGEQSDRLQELVAGLSDSAVDLSSLGEAFAAAVTQQQSSNQALTDGLLGIEAALEQAGQRNDEHMNFYLEQAREIIDHNLLAQQELLQR